MAVTILSIGPQDWPVLWQGLTMTLEIAFFSMAGGLLLGLILGTLLFLKLRIVSSLVTAYIQILRSVPLVLFVVGLFLVLPFSPKVVAILALGLYATASVADIIRGGLQSIDKTQLQAAQVLGLSLTQRLCRVALPQAAGRMMPALVNQGSVMIKDTTLVSIGVMELTKAISLVNLRHLDHSIGFLLLGCAIYFILCASISLMGNQLEKKFCKGLKPARL